MGLVGWFISFLSPLSSNFYYGVFPSFFLPRLFQMRSSRIDVQKTDYTPAFRKMQNMPMMS
jgi:hypothetical protein